MSFVFNRVARRWITECQSPSSLQPLVKLLPRSLQISRRSPRPSPVLKPCPFLLPWQLWAPVFIVLLISINRLPSSKVEQKLMPLPGEPWDATSSYVKTLNSSCDHRFLYLESTFLASHCHFPGHIVCCSQRDINDFWLGVV